MKVLVTGASGMIGSYLVRELLDKGFDVIGIERSKRKMMNDRYIHHRVDLGDREALTAIISGSQPDRIIHLAALAHSVDGKEYTWDRYKYLNVDCAKNVFSAAGQIPVLFISTVDVFGFTRGIVSADTEPRPVSFYAKSKMMAEEECKKLDNFDIFRFSPVYTDEVKRDIQKRYYLKYPKIAYLIGKGSEYEILNIKRAVESMVIWCGRRPENKIRIIKDQKRMSTREYIKAEKKSGRAKVVLYVPRWMARCGYVFIKKITGENKYTYLLNKAVFPLRTRDGE